MDQAEFAIANERTGTAAQLVSPESLDWVTGQTLTTGRAECCLHLSLLVVHSSLPFGCAQYNWAVDASLGDQPELVSQ